MNGIWLVAGADCSSPQRQIVSDDDAKSPYDLTGAALRLDIYDAGHTGRADASASPLVTGTDADGTVVVDDPAGGKLHFALSALQSRRVIDGSWANARVMRRVEFRLWRTDGGQQIPLFETIEWATA